MTKYSAIIIFLIPLSLFSGWENSYGYKLWICRGYSVIQTIDDDFTLAANVRYNSSQPPYSINDVYFLHLNSEGEIIWEKQYGDSLEQKIYNCIQTFDGGYAAFGWTETYNNGIKHADIWLIKLDNFGDTTWTKVYGGMESNDWGWFGQQTSDSGFIIIGYKQDRYSLQYNIVLSKINSYGDSQWVKVYGNELGLKNIGFAVKQIDDGGYILSGFTKYQFTQLDTADIYIIRTDLQGNLRWSKIFSINQSGEIDADIGYSITQTIDKGIIVAGTAHWVSNNNNDMYILKLDSMGNKEWERMFGGLYKDEAHSIQQCEDRGYIIAGFTASFGSGGYDVYLLKTDEYGLKIWDRTFGGVEDEGAYYVQQTSDKGYIITGWTDSYAITYTAIYVIKTDSLGVAVEENIITLPTRNCFSVNYLGNLRTAIRFSLIQSSQVRVDVYDLSGRRIGTPADCFYPAGEYCIYWQAPLPGIYFFRIRSDQLDKTEKTAVLR